MAVTTPAEAPAPAETSAAAEAAATVDPPAAPLAPPAQEYAAPEPAAADAPVTVNVLTPAAPAGSTSTRDAGNLRLADWPLQPLPAHRGRREPRFQALVRQSVLDDIHKHGRSAPDVEVCGVLVGNVYQDGVAPYLHVQASIRGSAAAGKDTQVTFTAETWAQIQAEMDRKHADKKMLGWYHTHPGFGIFLSGMDVFIHENFFGESWQAAYVYDPKGGDDGMFLWRAGTPVREPMLVETEGGAGEQSAADALGGPAAAPHSANATDTLVNLSARVQALESRLRWAVAALVLVGLAALLLPVLAAIFMPDWADRLRRSVMPAGADAVERREDS